MIHEETGPYIGGSDGAAAPVEQIFDEKTSSNHLLGQIISYC